MSGLIRRRGIPFLKQALTFLVAVIIAGQYASFLAIAKPVIEIYAPDPAEVVKGIFTIEARVSGDPDEVRLYMDNMWISNMRRLGTSTTYQHYFDTLAFPDGAHNVRVWAKDASGSDSVGYSFYIDNVGPQISNITFSYPGNQQAAKKSDKVTVLARISDSPSGMATVTCDASRMGGLKDVVMYDDGFHNDSVVGDGVYGSDTIVIGVPTNGWTLVNMTAFDKAGNVRRSSAFIALDNHPPDLERPIVVYPQGQSALKLGDQVRIVVNTSDVGAGGTVRMGVDVVLVLDNSGSMVGKPMEDLKAAVKSFVNISEAGDRIAIYAFGDDGTMNYESSKRYMDFTNMDELGKQDVFYLLDEDYEFNRGYNTPIWDTIGEGINYAITMHENTPCVIALTDGTDFGYDWYDKPDPTWWQDWYYSGLGFERGSEAYAPWNTWDTNVHYTTHYGEYFLFSLSEIHSFDAPIKDLTGFGDYPEGWNDRDFDDGVRRGLLQVPIPVYTIGMNISHHEPLKSNTTEYDLANIGITSKFQETSGKYFYAPSSNDLESTYKSISYYINLGGDLNISPPGGIKEFTVDANILGVPVKKPLFDDGGHDDIYPKDEVFGTDMMTVNTRITEHVNVTLDASDITRNTATTRAEIDVDNILPTVTNVVAHYPRHSGPFEYAKDGEMVWLEADVQDIGNVSGITKVELDGKALGAGGSIVMVDDGSGRDSVAGDGTYTTFGNIVIASGGQNGNLKVTARAYDRALNLGTADGSVLVRNIDTVILNITDPKDGQYIEGVHSFKVFANAPDVIDQVEMSIATEGSTGTLPVTSFMTFGATTGDYRSDVDTHVLPDGTYIMNVSATDILEGTYSAMPVGFNIDNNPPTIALGGVNDGDIISGAVVLNATIKDVFPCDLRFKLDNGSWSEKGPNLNNAHLIGLVIRDDGPHDITLEAIDPIGHRTNMSIGVIVDTTPPKIIPVDLPMDGANVTGKVHLSFAIEEAIGLEEVYLKFDDGSTRDVPYNPYTGLYEMDVNSSDFKNGVHTVTIHAKDHVGLTDNLTRTFNIQNAGEPPPGITEIVRSMPIYFWAIIILLAAALIMVAAVYIRERILHKDTEKMLRSIMDKRGWAEGKEQASGGPPTFTQSMTESGKRGRSRRAQEVGRGMKREKGMPQRQVAGPRSQKKISSGRRPPTKSMARTVEKRRVPLDQLLREETSEENIPAATSKEAGIVMPRYVRCPVCQGKIAVTSDERPLIITCTICGSMGRLGG